MRRLIMLLTIVAVLTAACGGAADSSSEAEPALDSAGAAADGLDEEAAGADRAEGGEDGASAPLGDVALVSTNDRIIREGTVRIEVAEDAFDDAFNAAVMLADRFGGTVLASDATTRGDDTTSGSVTIRVPSADYDDLLVAAADIGEVRRRNITARDVSDEFVDLEARLRHNQAQERFYLSLLDRAESVEDAIAVQQRMDGIQQTIEQIQGRLRFLEERTSFSRLTIELVESGAEFRTSAAQPTFARYWAAARSGLVNVLGMTMVVLIVAVPFLLAGVLAYVVYRRITADRRAVRAPAPPGPPRGGEPPTPVSASAPAAGRPPTSQRDATSG